MPGRKFNSNQYRYGFNGKENDNETVGTGEGTQDYGMRIYNPSLGRWFTTDPSFYKYPDWSPYKAFRDNPIIYEDPDGGDEYLTIIVKKGNNVVHQTVKTSDAVYTDNKIVLSNGAFGGHYNQKNWFDKETTIVYDYDENGKVTKTSSEKLLTDNVKATTSGPVINSQSYATSKSELFEADDAFNKYLEKKGEEITKEYGGGGSVKVKQAPTKGEDFSIWNWLFNRDSADPTVSDENYYPNADKSRVTTPEQKKARNAGDTVINIYGDGEGNSWYGAATIDADGTENSVLGQANKGQVDRHGNKDKK